MADQPIKPTNTTQPSTVVAPKQATPISITEPPIKPFTKEETAESLNVAIATAVVCAEFRRREGMKPDLK